MESGIVFIDSFRCEPVLQDALRRALEDACRAGAGAAGFLGATVLVGSDHTRVTALVRLRGEADLMRLRGTPGYAAAMREAEGLASGHDPRWFRPVGRIDPLVGIDIGD